jgi:hypothetical protein
MTFRACPPEGDAGNGTPAISRGQRGNGQPSSVHPENVPDRTARRCRGGFRHTRPHRAAAEIRMRASDARTRWRVCVS